MLALQNEVLHRSQLLNAHRVSQSGYLPEQGSGACGSVREGLPSKEERGKQQPAACSSLLPKCQLPDQERLTQVPRHATSTQTFSWRQKQLLCMETAAAAAASWVANSQLFSPILPRAHRNVLTFNELLPPCYPHCALVHGVLFNLPFSTSPEEMNLAFYLSRHKEGLEHQKQH